MKKVEFKVNLTPRQTMAYIRENKRDNLLYDQTKEIGDGRIVSTLIYDKYFIRLSNRVTLLIMIDDINGFTNVSAVATGSSKGSIVKYDLGAKETYINSLKNLLQKYIVD